MANISMLVFLWGWNNYLDPPVFLANWRRMYHPGVHHLSRRAEILRKVTRR